MCDSWTATTDPSASHAGDDQVPPGGEHVDGAGRRVDDDEVADPVVGAHGEDAIAVGRPAQLGEVGAGAGELSAGLRAVGGDDEHLVPARRLVGVGQQAAVGRPRRGPDVAAGRVDNGDVDAGGDVGDVQARAVEVVAVEQRRGDTRRVRGHLGLAPVAVAAGEQRRPRIADVDHGERGRLVPSPAPVDGDDQPVLVDPHRRRAVAERRRAVRRRPGRWSPCRRREGDP